MIVVVQSRAEKIWSIISKVSLTIILIAAVILGWLLFESNVNLKQDLFDCQQNIKKLEAKRQKGKKLSLSLGILSSVAVFGFLISALIVYFKRKVITNLKFESQIDQGKIKNYSTRMSYWRVRAEENEKKIETLITNLKKLFGKNLQMEFKWRNDRLRRNALAKNTEGAFKKMQEMVTQIKNDVDRANRV